MVQDMGTTFNVKGDGREHREMTLGQVYYPLTTASRRVRPLCEIFCSSLCFGSLATTYVRESGRLGRIKISNKMIARLPGVGYTDLSIH